jgi:pimeloyl-ACP methyl ester carboxylesterase
MWDPVVVRLDGARRVLTPDLPGHGDEPPQADASPPALAAAIADRLARDGIERPHVAGNSLGGWIALELAAAGRAASVTAIAPAGLWREPLVPKRSSARAGARALLPVLGPLLRTERGRRLVLAANAAHPERIPPDAALALVRAYAMAPGFQAVNDAMRASRFTALAEISVPVTLAWPEHDRLVRRPRSLPDGVRSVVLRGCGHLPTWDDPEQVARVLLEGSAGERQPRH